MIVTAKTIEGLLRYLGIQLEDTKQAMDKKLNEHRIEIQGQKPNKIKKQMKPNKFENVREGGTAQQETHQAEKEEEKGEEGKEENNQE